GVSMAEPVTSLISGGACFITMLATIWPELSEKRQQ
ncbi:MAG TPA: Na+-driven multidrug efflux pump, partial [Clostridium sp.]|nr:Na+-driven multidrug efflux pump [Clostridium sp.]